MNVAVVVVDQGLADTSNLLFGGAVLAYTIGMSLFAVSAAFSRRERATEWGRVATLATVATVIGWSLQLGCIVTRGLAAGRVPWGNMYEFSTAVSFVAVTVLLVLLWRQRTAWLGVFVLLPVVLYMGLAGTVLYADAGPLNPALDSYWLKIHVVAAMTSTGVFMVSGVTAALFLIRERYERRLAAVGPGTMSATERRGTSPPGRGRRPAVRGLGGRLPAAERLDRLTYSLVIFAFPIFTFAVIAGAIWAEAAWSRYWGWDPKETWSFITWVTYAGYLHSRATAGWRGRKSAWFAVAAFATLIINYYVVNIWVTGLHSYAGLD